MYEKLIKEYFRGWELKNWQRVASLLSADFTFTSPAPDDHISLAAFEQKCWKQAEHIERIEFVDLCGDANRAFALLHVITKSRQLIRNVEHFVFRGAQIASIEVFFGGTGRGFPTNASALEKSE